MVNGSPLTYVFFGEFQDLDNSFYNSGYSESSGSLCESHGPFLQLEIITSPASFYSKKQEFGFSFDQSNHFHERQRPLHLLSLLDSNLEHVELYSFDLTSAKDLTKNGIAINSSIHGSTDPLYEGMRWDKKPTEIIRRPCEESYMALYPFEYSGVVRSIIQGVVQRDKRITNPRLMRPEGPEVEGPKVSESEFEGNASQGNSQIYKNYTGYN